MTPKDHEQGQRMWMATPLKPCPFPGGHMASGQVAAAYRVARAYEKMADGTPNGLFAEMAGDFAKDLREALDRAGQLRPAELAAEDLRANILAIHQPEQIWTDEVVDLDTGESEQHALYGEGGELVASTEVRTVCSACAPRMNLEWPCPTARAAGVTE